MLVTPQGHRGYRFGEFLLDLDRGALLRDGEEVRLRPKSFDMLCVLLENAGTLVSRAELLQRVWPDTVVTDDSINQCLLDIRRALGDEHREWVRTVPRRGVIFDMHVEPPGAPAEKRSRVAYAWAGGALLLGLAAAAYLVFQGRSEPPATATVEPVPNPVLAVLPFQDLSPEPTHDWFAGGLAEEVLLMLAQLPQLDVIARTSSFALGSGSSALEAAQRLDAAWVVTGSIVHDQHEVRVQAELLDAARDEVLWSGSFERELDSVFGLQTEIAGAIGDELRHHVPLLAAVEPEPAVKPAAWNEYLRGKFLYARAQPGDMELARHALMRSVQLDPASARAWTALAGMYAILGWNGLMERDLAHRLRFEAVSNALALDPGSAEAHLRMAQHHRSQGDPERGQLHLDQARAHAHNSPLVLMALGRIAMAAGRFEEATALLRRAVKLDPLNVQYHLYLVETLFFAGEYAAMREHAETVVELGPHFAEHVATLEAFALVLEGRLDEAEQAVLKLSPGSARDHGLATLRLLRGDEDGAAAPLARLRASEDPLDRVHVAEALVAGGDPDAAFLALAQAKNDARAAADQGLAWDHVRHNARISPFLAELRADRRWTSWVEEG